MDTRDDIPLTAGHARRLAARLALAAVLTFGATFSYQSRAVADPVKGEITATITNGYARLIFNLAQEVEADVKISNNILIVSFREPVDLTVDKLAASAPGYITAARLDPDHKGVRLALARKVTANTMAAAERLFIDLLPANWAGLPPGLPQEVVEELTRRAREAEKIVRQRRAQNQQAKAAPIRVRVSTQPTFTRYVFALPELTAVTTDRAADKLTLAFDASLSFDLADAKSGSPPVVSGLKTEVDKDTVIVQFNFAEKVDVRTFREDNDYIVDVGRPEGPAAKSEGGVKPDDLARLAIAAAERGKPPVSVQAPETVPARSNPAVATQSPATGKPVAQAIAPEKTAPESPAVIKPATTAPVEEKPPVAPPVAGEGASAPPVPSKTVTPAAGSKPQSPMVADGSPPAGLLAGIVIPSDPSQPAGVTAFQDGGSVHFAFAFAEQTPAAIFRRADALWLVFDTRSPLSVAPINQMRLPTIRDATVGRIRDVAVVQIKLERPRLVGVKQDGNTWLVTLSDKIDPPQSLNLIRDMGTRPTVTIPFDHPGRVHRLTDVEVGDTLLVVTASGAARGFARPQDFVEFRALPSFHGVVIQAWADDLVAETSTDKIVISRPSGLILSAGASARDRGGGARPGSIDPNAWGFDRQANFVERKETLVAAAADAPEARRFSARVDLARFYLARDMYPEARAVLDVAVTDSPPTTDVTGAIMLRGIADVMLDRPDDALKDFSNPAIGDQFDAPLWRAVTDARLGKWAAAREGFRNSGAIASSLPIELQRSVLLSRIRAAVEVGDFADAATQMAEFEVIGAPADLQPMLTVLSGRIAEGLGRSSEALTAYRQADEASNRPVAAQARLRSLLLRRSLGQLNDADAIPELESLVTSWRGDETEIEALRLLTHLYVTQGRHREAFQMMRVALTAHRNSEVTRRIHEEAIETFDSLFLAGKGDALPAIDALSLFYDFRELTPVGRRGDEMIRRLADRLVSVDLLDQAADLLQHQVDHRLQGVARAQIATRLAVVHLMNRHPERALTVLRATRQADLPTELRTQRLLVEARALADTGRTGLGLEIIAGIEGPQAVRLRADIMWTAKDWRGAAEQLELLHGDRWKQFEPLNDAERSDILRAAIGYALGEDTIGLERFRERYAGKFRDGPDRRAFDVVTQPLGMSGTEFREIVRSISAVDSLDAFIADLRARYPNSGTLPPGAAVQPPGQ